MTTTPDAQTIAEPVAPPECEAGPGTGPAGVEIHERPKPAPGRWWRGQKSENPWRNKILAGLEKPGCFVCREAVSNLHRYYFWFLAEQYANIPTMDRLQRSHGFCLRHTRHLLERGAADRISYVAEYVLRSCADWLRSFQVAARQERGEPRPGRRHASVAFRPAVGCPACEDERASVQLHAEVLVGCLDEADIVQALRKSDGLCLPHFLAAAREAGWETLQCLAEEQIRHLEEARTNLSAIQVGGTNGAMAETLRAALERLYGPDLDGRIRPFLAAARKPGETRAASRRQPVSAKAGGSATWSPALEETCHLLRQPGCSLCRVAARGREEYLAWLEQEIRDCPQIRHRWDQALFLCGPHAWLFADRCAPEVLAAAGDRFLGKAAGTLRDLLWEIRNPIPPGLMGRMRALPARWRESGQPEPRAQGRSPMSRRIRRTLGSLWQTPRRFLDRKREQFLRRDACPLCHHLETIEGRAADRLVAVLETAEGREAFERSYGLCLRHASFLFERAGAPDLRREIAAVLLARIGVDLWEVVEYSRKISWSVRHEPKGAEQEAWLRASTRIAGIAVEQEYDF